MKKLYLIINPCSGTKKIKNELIDIITKLNKEYDVQVAITQYHNHAKELAEKTKNDVDVVACAGGDGTLNQVISGLISSGNENKFLGYIPCGSTNDFSISYGIPTNIKEATKGITIGTPHLIDIGEFNKDKYFSYIASFGLFSSVSYSTPQEIKNIFGHSAYIVSGLMEIGSYTPKHIKITVDNNTEEGDYIFGAILNTTSIGGVLRLNTDIDFSDGLFECVFIKEPKDFTSIDRIIYGIKNFDFSNPIFTFAKTNEIKLEFDGSLSWSLDGEETKTKNEVIIKNLHNKIKILK